MVFWIKKIANSLAVLAFFGVFLYAVDPENLFDMRMLLFALLKGALSGVVFWFAGFIIADIAFKGIIEDVSESDETEIFEGGLVQRFKTENDATSYDTVLKQAADPHHGKGKVLDFLKKVQR